jgi:hypothetical protein
MSSGQKPQDPAQGNEIVFTVNDYYDGPLKGIANFQDKPHFYERIFDSATDDYLDLYRLTPVDERTFRMALEDWEIWCRWEVAFHASKAKIESHPALPEDTSRHEELKQILDKALQSSTNAIVRTGAFSAGGNSDVAGIRRPQQVKWTNPSTPID